MLLKLPLIGLLALLSLSPPQSQADEIAALKRQLQELKTQQSAMERDLQAIKAILQEAQGQGADPFVNKSIDLAGGRTRGNASAKITVVEVSDYHCPFCRRQTLQTLPQVLTDYVDTGKVKYVLRRLSDRAAPSGRVARTRSGQLRRRPGQVLADARQPVHERAGTRGRPVHGAGQGAWTRRSEVRSVPERRRPRRRDPGQRRTDAAARRRRHAVDAHRPDPAPGAPMKVVSSIYGARPYADFKAAIDAALAEAR